MFNDYMFRNRTVTARFLNHPLKQIDVQHRVETAPLSQVPATAMATESQIGIEQIQRNGKALNRDQKQSRC